MFLPALITTTIAAVAAYHHPPVGLLILAALSIYLLYRGRLPIASPLLGFWNGLGLTLTWPVIGWLIVAVCGIATLTVAFLLDLHHHRTAATREVNQ